VAVFKPRKNHVGAYSIGYGVRSSHRDGGSADKRSRRFTPYGDKDAGRMYKNIVPAPRKESDTSSVVSPSNASGSSSPKRKRKEDIELPDYSQQPGI
jgi:hypothetical protein